MTGTTSTRPPPTWWGTTPWRSSPRWGTPAASSTISGASSGRLQASGDQRQPNGHDSWGRILEYFRAVLGGSKPTTGHTVRVSSSYHFCKNNWQKKFEVSSISNQSYFQHILCTIWRILCTIRRLLCIIWRILCTILTYTMHHLLCTVSHLVLCLLQVLQHRKKI